MVDRAGNYYGTPFKGHQGVTHEYPISPTIFNMVVDGLICNCFLMVTGEDSGPGGFGWEVQWLVVFFYTQAVPAPSGAGFPDSIVRQGDPPDQRKQNGWDGVSDLLHCMLSLVGGVYTSDDGCVSIPLGD